MNESKNLFDVIGEKLKDVQPGKLFGKPCLKINGKAFACFFQDESVFKLSGDIHAEALSLDGSRLFDPSGKGRPMREWVQVSYDYSEKWEEFAQAAKQYVKGK